jgi:L-cysteine S-thiosulfotransferase
MRGWRAPLLARGVLSLLVVAISIAALQACTATLGSGFYLPLGDAARGRQAFKDLQCPVCHELSGVDPAPTSTAATRVRLGGETLRIKTYGDLVTSIVNPSHRIVRGYPREAVTTNGVSSMEFAHLNTVMTVQQLVDVVAFLQSEYRLPPPLQPYWQEYPINDPDVITRPRRPE